METLESLQDPVYETGVDVLQLGLSEQGFGEVAIPRLDDDSAAEHRGRLIGAMAIAMGSLALAAPAAASAERAEPATGIVATATTEQYKTNPLHIPSEILPNQANWVKVVPLKYKKINSRCGVEPFKITPTVGKLDYFNVLAGSDTAPKKYRTIIRFKRTLDETGIKIPAMVCHIKNATSSANLLMLADGKDDLLKNYVFNWPKKKWIVRK